MGFDITDLADSKRIVFVNFWNWHPTVELIRAADLLDPQRLDGLHQQCSATRISTDEARAIARYLREVVLPKLVSESRVYSTALRPQSQTTSHFTVIPPSSIATTAPLTHGLGRLPHFVNLAAASSSTDM